MPPVTDARRPFLVIVSGVPGAGKTTLGTALRDLLCWPLLSKDRFKEHLFDASGMTPGDLDQSTSRTLGTLADAALHAVVMELLAARCSCIVESFFLPERAAPLLADLAAISNARQLHCTVPAAVSIARYHERYESGLRHPVHLDHLEAGDRAVDPIPEANLRPVPLDVPLLLVNTVRGYAPAMESILTFLRTGVQ